MITLLKEQSASILSDKISEICKLIPAFQKEILWDTRGMANAKTRQTKDSVVYTFKNGSVIRGVVIDSLDNISSYDYDILIVAVKDEEFFEKIKFQLMKKNLDVSKISWIKPEICLDTFYYNI